MMPRSSWFNSSAAAAVEAPKVNIKTLLAEVDSAIDWTVLKSDRYVTSDYQAHAARLDSLQRFLDTFVVPASGGASSSSGEGAFRLAQPEELLDPSDPFRAPNVLIEVAAKCAALAAAGRSAPSSSCVDAASTAAAEDIKTLVPFPFGEMADKCLLALRLYCTTSPLREALVRAIDSASFVKALLQSLVHLSTKQKCTVLRILGTLTSAQPLYVLELCNSGGFSLLVELERQFGVVGRSADDLSHDVTVLALQIVVDTLKIATRGGPVADKMLTNATVPHSASNGFITQLHSSSQVSIGPSVVTGSSDLPAEPSWQSSYVGHSGAYDRPHFIDLSTLTPSGAAAVHSGGDSVTTKDGADSGSPSFTARGLSMAVSIFNDFLRLTPLSSSWLAAPKNQQSSSKEPELLAGLVDESLYFDLFTVPSYVLEGERRHWSELIGQGSASQGSELSLGMELSGFFDEPSRSRGASRASDGSAGPTLLCSILGLELHAQGAVGWLFDIAETVSDFAAVSSALRGIFELQAEDHVVQKYLLARLKALYSNAVRLLAGAETPAEGHFGSLTALLLSFIVNSCCYREDASSSDHPLHPILPACGALVKNTSMLAVLPELFQAGSTGALAAGSKLVYVLLWSNALNIVTLEEFGVMSAFYLALARVVLSGKLRSSAGSAEEGVTAEMLDVLQLASVITTERDKSCVALLLHLCLALSVGAAERPVGHTLRHTRGGTRCLNCETDAAHYECLHDSCLKGGSYCGLCVDCDTVFHKGSEKRGHVRVPIVADADALASSELLVSSNKYCSAAAMECHNYIAEAGMGRTRGWRESGDMPQLLSLLRCLGTSVDDRRARGWLQLQELMKPLLLVFRRSLLPWSVDADPTVSEQMPLDVEDSELRRQIVSQLVQLVPRVLLDVASPQRQQSEAARYLQEQRTDMLQAFRAYGGDALLVFLLLEQPPVARAVPRTALSSAERQFITWILREALLCSIEAGAHPEGSEQESCSVVLLKWLLWLVACPVAGCDELSNENCTLPIDIPPLSQLHNYLQPCSSNRGQGARVPLSRARVLPDTRLFLLQELKLLMSGSVLESVHDFSSLDASLSSLPAAFHRIPIRSVTLPSLSTASSAAHKQPGSRSNSFDLSLMSRDAEILEQVRHRGLDGGDRDSGAPEHVLFCRVLTVQMGVQSLLVAVGAVEVALHLVLGELCDPRIAVGLASRVAPAPSTGGDIQDIGASALAVEIWWAALGYLGHLVCGCRAAKERVDSYAGASSLAQALIPLTRSSVQLAEQSSASDRFAQNYCSDVLARLLVELCVDRGSVLAPCGLRNYIATSHRVPLPLAPVAGAGRSALIDLIARPAISALRACTDLTDLCHEYLGSNISLVQVSPVYFAREEHLALQRPLVHPPPLRLGGMSALRHLNVEPPRTPTPLHAARATGPPMQHSSSVRNPPFGSRLNLLDGLEGRKSWGGSAGIDSSALDENFLNRKRVAALLGIPGMIPQAADSDMWDNESVGGKAGSVHSTSLQSLRSLSQALRSATHTPGTSVNGDVQHHRVGRLLKRQPSNGSSYTFISSANIGSADPFGESLAIPLYYPMLAALNWGDNSSIELVLQLLSEALLRRARLVEPVEPECISDCRTTSSDQLAGTALDIQLNTLRRKLLSFLPPLNDRKMSMGVTLWQPPFSRLLVRSPTHAAILVSLAMVTRGEVQAQTLSTLSHIIDGNPKNADLFSRDRAMLVSIIRLLPSLGERPRTAFSYLVSQLLRHHVEDAVLQELVRSASMINGQSLLDLLSAALDRGSTADALSLADGSYNRDDHSSQLLFIIGRCAERISPHCFAHFDQGNALSSKIALPRIDRLPPSKTGFTIASWMRIGSLGNAPTAGLMQLALQTPGSSASVDVYFRVVYRINAGDVDTISIASADVFNVDETIGLPKRSLQLCISHKAPSAKQPGAPDDLWSSVVGRGDSGTQDTAISGSRPHASMLASSIASYSFPDAIVDLDWSEMGEWHFLVLAFSDGGIQCWVDGRERLMQQWTALGLGYVPGYSAAWQYPSGACSLETTVGGLGCEAAAYDKLLETACGGGGAREDEVLLEAHRAMVGGFSGTVADTVVFEGCRPDPALLDRCVLVGPSAGIAQLLPRRLSSMSIEGLTKQSSKQQEKPSSVFTIGLFSSSTEGDLPRQADVQGSVSLHRTSTLVDAMRASRLGLKTFFPLLVADRGRQVAALRIIASVIAATTLQDAPLAGARGFFKDVILYCTAKANPKITTIETLQVLFDCGGQVAAGENGQGLRQLQSSMLSLIVDIAVSLESRPALSRGAIDWLRELCDENIGNCRLVLQTVGVTPFLIIISMWTLTAQQISGAGAKYRLLKNIDMLRPEVAQGGQVTELRASSSPYAETYRAQQLLNERSRLILGCSRLLKQLITGTTGIQTDPLGSGGAAGTPTGFSTEHLGAMLSAVLLLVGQGGGVKRGSRRETVGDGSDGSRSRGRAAPTEAKGSCDEQPAWALQASVAILDNILSAADGPLFNTILGMLNAAFPGNALWMAVLTLLGSRHVEIRERSLRLLYISLSSSSGRPEPRLLSAFEQIQGFEMMAEQLAQYKADDTIVDAVLALLFWSEAYMPRPYGGHVGPTNDSEAEEIPPAGDGTGRGSTGEQTAQDLVLDGRDRAAAADGSAGVLTSIFSWRGGAAPVGGSRGSFPNPTLPHTEEVQLSSPLHGIAPSALSPVTISSISKPLVGSGDAELRAKRQERRQSSRRPSLNRALPDTLSLDGSTLPQGRADSSLPEDTTGVDGGSDGGDAIVVPQAIVPLLRLLRSPKDAAMIERACRLLIKCLKYDVAAIEPDSVSCATKTRNAELILSQRDWLLLLASCIAKLRRLVVYSDDIGDGREAFSESESINEFQHSATDTPGELNYFSSSEDSFDMRGDGASGMGHESVSHCQSTGGRLAAILASYTGPLLDLVQTLLMMVLSWRPSVASKYLSEIFLLSASSTMEVQNIMLCDLLGSIEALTLRSTAASVNILRNFLFVFSQVPEKTELSKDFCLQTLHVLHSLGYYSSPEMRQRMKETGVTDLRNVFVCNVIFLHQLELRAQRSLRSDQEAAKQLAAAGRGERVESLYLTVMSLKELEPSLVAYLSSTEPKLLLDNQIMYIVLGLFCDAVEDLDYISGVDPLSSEFSGIDVNYTLERVQMLLDALQKLVELLQCIASVSPDCRRHLLRTLQDFPGTASENLVSAMVYAFQQKGSEQPDFPSQGGSQHASSWFTWSSANPQATLPAAAMAATDAQILPQTLSDSDKSIVRSSSSSNSSSNNSSSNNSGAAHRGGGSSPERLSQEITEANKVLPSASKVERINSFLDWYCVVENKDLHSEMRRRVGANLRPIERQSEKHQEKLMEKRSKLLRALQERLTKSKQQAVRHMQEGLSRMGSIVDKGCDQSRKEFREWSRALGQRAEAGRSEFAECIRAGRYALALPGPEPSPLSAVLVRFLQIESANVSYSSQQIRPNVEGRVQAETQGEVQAFAGILGYVQHGST